MIEGATMGREDNTRFIYASPWRERMADGTLGGEYGPKSAATLAKHTRASKDWSFKVQRASKAAVSVDAEALRAWMRLEDGTLRTGIAEGEAMAFILVCEHGNSERAAARKLKVSRRTVRVRLARLMERAVRDQGTVAT
jgi:DNA-directed RNA polymerase specialized sigma24 family protein